MSRARRGAKPELGDLVARAKVSNHRGSPRKVRDVVDLIRGLTLNEAMGQLAMTHRPSSVPMLTRLLKSAHSNANHETESRRLEGDDLIIGRIFVDGGPMMKRFKPMAMGRAGRIRKRTCHVTVELYTHPE